jgi:hypothetical protein
MAKRKFLFTADLHLTVRKLDEYRWEIFHWLARQAISREASAVFILGDLTDEKDNHPQALVNGLINGISHIVEQACPVVILKGNHDYLANPKDPYFDFLRRIPGVSFFTNTQTVDYFGYDFLMIPHFKTSLETEMEKSGESLTGHDFILFHQGFYGARVANGMQLEHGVDPKHLAKARVGGAFVIGGDIHAPQQVGNLHYTGSPYAVQFGDRFEPRVLFFDGTGLRSVPRAGIQKLVLPISDPDEIDGAELYEGDQVRIVVQLPKSSFLDWPVIREGCIAKCKKLRVELCGLSLAEKVWRERFDLATKRKKESLLLAPGEVFRRYVGASRVPSDLVQAGQRILEKTISDNGIDVI